ncbi:hypothetical protein [Pseudactinotalea terrae]|uniref:hypothetical protein n=1 Tax=Pseudactinotalea terrae TaxID=1743262 RepID=UPI0012E0E431|nr:hypothetical protein [Pseudactinotalea terrae]
MRRRWVIIALAVLAVVVGITSNLADARLLPYGPVAATGAMGEDVSAFPYTVHVNHAQAAASIVEAGRFEPPPPTTTDGVWVVVNLSYATEDEVRIPGSSALVLRAEDGRQFPVSNRSPARPWLAGADIWVRGDLAFEVAPDTLDGLMLVFDPELKIYGPMPMQYAQIPLDLDPDDVVEVLDLTETETLPVGKR